MLFKKDKETKLVGAEMPLPLNQYLTLYSLSFGVTKSEIIRYIITSWKKKELNEETLIASIRQEIEKTMKIKGTDPDFNQENFVEETKQYLKSKGINDQNINLILNDIYEKD